MTAPRKFKQIGPSRPVESPLRDCGLRYAIDISTRKIFCQEILFSFCTAITEVNLFDFLVLAITEVALFYEGLILEPNLMGWHYGIKIAWEVFPMPTLEF